MTFDIKDVKILDKENLYEGYNSMQRLTLNVKYFNGDTSPDFQRECVLRPKVAGIIPYDLAKDQVVLVEQFRIGALSDEKSPWLLEFAAGIMDKDGEECNAMAIRELYEETGLKVKSLFFIMKYWVSPGANNEQVSLYWANVDSSLVKNYCGVHAEHEDIKVHVVPFFQAKEMMERGEISNSLTIIGLQWLQIHRNNLKKMYKI